MTTGVVTETGEMAGSTGIFGDGSGSGSGSLGTGTGTGEFNSLVVSLLMLQHSTLPGLPTGAKVGIAVGSTAAVLALVISAVITWRLKVKARMSLTRRKSDTEVKGCDPGRTEIPPQLQIIRHSGLPAASTRYN